MSEDSRTTGPTVTVGDIVRTPRGEGRVVAVDGRWMTVEIDLCGSVDTAVVRVPPS